MNVSGIVIRFACLVIIGIFHPIVIKCEYYFSARAWPVFLVMGIAGLGLSVIIESDILSGKYMRPLMNAAITAGIYVILVLYFGFPAEAMF